MRVTRIHVPAPLAEGAEIELPAQAAKHLTRVLRLEPGAALTLFNGTGGEYAAELGAGNGKRVTARVLGRSEIDRDSPLSVTLLQGVARGERMDLIVQKATELGVSRIVPVLAERSVVKVDTRQRARKLEHWQAIAISACEQCGRNRVPSIVEPLPLGDAIGQLTPDTGRALLAADGASSLMAFATKAAGRPLALLIGPEGGLADSERQFAFANGFEGCRLGPRILRTETAGLAALATLQAIAGDFST
jgi:16S rRNA (uracil1498-N3)-methyltransferase